MKTYKSISEIIGNTPLVELCNIEKEFSLCAHLFAKVEFLNPAGSTKDRAARQMLDDAEKSGKINKNTVIIEPTSGNTGIGLSALGAARGYRVVIVMPDTMSIERIKLMKAYGAEVVLTDGKLGMKGAIDKANELAEKYESAFIPDQFGNPSNAAAHYNTTGPEIWADTDGKVDFFVAGIGTGGTISGTAKFLKEKSNSVKVVGIEPYGSPFITKGVAGAHKLQGIGAGFIPSIYDASVVDEVVTVKDDDAIKTGAMLPKKEGILVGISSGAALYAAIEIAKKEENSGKNIVVLLPDTGDRYLSTEMF